MAVADRAVQIAPYVEQLLENDDVRDNIRRAATSSRDAYKRTRGKKKKTSAAKDRIVQRRLKETAEASRNAITAIREGPRKKQRRRRGRVVVLIGLGAAGAFVAANSEARAKLLAAFGDSGNGAAAEAA